MASQEGFANLNIYFVVPKECKSEEDCSDEMWEAYNHCLQNEFRLEWIEENNCLNLAVGKQDIFVLQDFAGAAFEQLQKSKCLIVGPHCMINCFLSGQAVPDGDHPIFTTAMRGLVVCVTGYKADVKAEIEKKVQWMGGTFIKQLRACATHLISNSVMSEKYENACQIGLPVRTASWIEALWTDNLIEFIKGDDPKYDEYKCPIFMGLVVTTTNLSKAQKTSVKCLIEDNGGVSVELMGALDGSKVKIVLAPENCPRSDKINYAQKNNIACLNIEWVEKSIEAGYSLPFGDYLVKMADRHSTPKKSHVPSPNCSTISALGVSKCSNNIVEETLGATLSSSVFEPASADRQSTEPYVRTLDRLDVRQAKLTGHFLDGCNIYLAGFPPHHRDKINKILNAGGATRLDDMSDALSHVIVADLSKASHELKTMKSRGLFAYVLGLDWLEESLKLKRPAPEEKFMLEMREDSNAQSDEPPSPLSKKNLQMLQKPKRPIVPKFDIDKRNRGRSEETDDGDDDASSIVQQYLRKENDERRTPPGSTISKTMSETTIPFVQRTPRSKMFKGLTFYITGFDKEEKVNLVQNITELGGRIVMNSNTGTPDFGVVPVLGGHCKRKVTQVVSDLYIEDCMLRQEEGVELMYYHHPVCVPSDEKPLDGVVITTTTYGGTERTYLTQVATALGATYQDTFARTPHSAKNLVANTHLLCLSPEGAKYKAAVKWKIPAVNAGWLSACLSELRRVDETPYLVGESIAPESSRKDDRASMAPPSTTSHSSTSATSTPVPERFQRHNPDNEDPSTPALSTPLMNKRLNALLQKSTPKSPFHIDTPNTPYGQLFRDNPSPEMRKEWMRWLSLMPDISSKTPPPKKRTPSTPLSELKAQFWAELNAEPIRPEWEEMDTDEVTSREKVDTVKSKETEKSPDPPINRKLFDTEDPTTPRKSIHMQIEQLDEVFQSISRSEHRSTPTGNAKVYAERPDVRIDKCLMKDSQPDTVSWEDPAHEKQALYKQFQTIDEPMEEDESMKNESPEPPRKFKFMLSGVKDKQCYEKVIKDLGGEVSTESNYDPSATHLLCIRPARNEKMLGSIAAGKWVLHCSYLTECEAQQKFIEEERYEWGNPLSESIIPETKGDPEKSLAIAAHRWRLKLEKEPGGAFQDIVALLLVADKRDQFERLITAGGGTVVEAKPPYDSIPGGKKITHCFIQMSKLAQPVEWAMLASKGILCFQPQYLSNHLTDEIPTNPRELVIPEFKKYLTLLPR